MLELLAEGLVVAVSELITSALCKRSYKRKHGLGGPVRHQHGGGGGAGDGPHSDGTNVFQEGARSHAEK